MDGSSEAVFDAVDCACAPTSGTVYDVKFKRLRNGKVRGVLTGLLMVSHEFVIVADDDVRYSEANLRDVLDALQKADLVRPQNYFEPVPWHARVDTARSLINRMTGGDWPGTLAVRRSTLEHTADTTAMCCSRIWNRSRRIVSRGCGRLPPGPFHLKGCRRALSATVAARTPAYDEFARPLRLVVALAGLPVLALVCHPPLALGDGTVCARTHRHCRSRAAAITVHGCSHSRRLCVRRCGSWSVPSVLGLRLRPEPS